jgi:hypothetical protein
MVSVSGEAWHIKWKPYFERHNGHTHHTQVYHGQSILPSQETRVEEPDTWYHDPDKGCRSQRPSDVTT